MFSGILSSANLTGANLTNFAGLFNAILSSFNLATTTGCSTGTPTGTLGAIGCAN